MHLYLQFKVVSSNIPLLLSRPHTHIYTHTSHTLHACTHTNSRDSHQRICITLRLLLPFILLPLGLPEQAHTQMYRLW